MKAEMNAELATAFAQIRGLMGWAPDWVTAAVLLLLAILLATTVHSLALLLLSRVVPKKQIFLRTLIARALAEPGLYGPLDPRWNVRDDERPAAEAKLVHFTTLHTQPWRPFPERFVYQEHPLAAVWHELERSADDAGFEIHTRARPSAAYVAWRAAERPGASTRNDLEFRTQVQFIL